jgi:hypothetical protein
MMSPELSRINLLRRQATLAKMVQVVVDVVVDVHVQNNRFSGTNFMGDCVPAMP